MPLQASEHAAAPPRSADPPHAARGGGRGRRALAGLLLLASPALILSCGDSTRPNQAPQVTIAAPATGQSFQQGQSVTFQGSATDRDGDEVTLAWSSSRDGQIGTGASVSTSTLSLGQHTITLTGTDPHGATGSATISLTVTGDPCADGPPIAIGQTLNGTLATGDCRLSDGTFVDFWTLTVTAQSGVRLTMTSTAVNAYVALFGPPGTFLGEDDNGGGGTNARLDVTLEPGTYIVAALSASANQTGAYQLSATAITGPPLGPCFTSQPITLGQTANGALSTSDCQLLDGTYTDRYQLTLAAATPVRITMRSTTFDTYLYLRRADHTLVAENDDGGGGTDSQIQMTLAAGTYIIWANSYEPNAIGSYTLSAEQVTAAVGSREPTPGSAGALSSAAPSLPDVIIGQYVRGAGAGASPRAGSAKVKRR